jgi:adenylate kinase
MMMVESKPLRVGLFGISGVGKSHLGRRIVAARPDVLHLVASTLLKDAHQVTGEALRTASADAVTRNQSVLADLINQVAAHRPHAAIVLDAHSVIDNDAGLVPVPYEAIEPIGLSAFLFLRDNPAAIVERRKDPSRRRPDRSVTELAAQQELAQKLCADYARLSGGQFAVLDGAEEEEALMSALKLLSHV